VPGYWADQGIRGLNGVVWYRKEIDVPASMAGVPAKLFLGRIVDADEAYVNGVRVGNITYQYPPRRYEVPATTLKAGKNIIVVRVTNTAGKGGFVPDKPYYITANGQSIDLKGEWQYKVGDVFAPGRGFGGGGGQISQQNIPTGLYNTMVAPVIPYAIKGATWYQGEANSGRPQEYAKLLPALIADWRNKWNDPQLPFLFVQLPNFMEMNYLPSESQWAQLRESQFLSLSVPNTAMAVAIDAGEWNDIHPLNKKDVGERLALAARKLAYGEDKLVASGPLYQSAAVEGNKIRISFSSTGSGLIAKDDDQLNYFAIAGADKKFVWAKAVIEGDKVVVWSEDVAAPLYVRYAWADNPDGANLYNREGLPASPFRTDK
jgi:sialate O-acetylesterase